MNTFLNWFQSIKGWQRNLLITFFILLCIFWLLEISDISEWWHWSEWQEHIKNEYK